ncbi:hypothetical protein TNCV_2623331 [Trichonephila clavipes]|nr:hypothetical protein TNCV_2623331 [Trichonephila clavipes]
MTIKQRVRKWTISPVQPQNENFPHTKSAEVSLGEVTNYLKRGGGVVMGCARDEDWTLQVGGCLEDNRGCRMHALDDCFHKDADSQLGGGKLHTVQHNNVNFASLDMSVLVFLCNRGRKCSFKSDQGNISREDILFGRKGIDSRESPMIALVSRDDFTH